MPSDAVLCESTPTADASKDNGPPPTSERHEQKENFFPFLQLPREIRDQVYDLVWKGKKLAVVDCGQATWQVLYEYFVVGQGGGDVRQSHTKPNAPVPWILTNKQILAEAAEQFERKATWMFYREQVGGVNAPVISPLRSFHVHFLFIDFIKYKTTKPHFMLPDMASEDFGPRYMQHYIKRLCNTPGVSFKVKLLSFSTILYVRSRITSDFEILNRRPPEDIPSSLGKRWRSILSEAPYYMGVHDQHWRSLYIENWSEDEKKDCG